jgi:hypothetical protein
MDISSFNVPKALVAQIQNQARVLQNEPDRHPALPGLLLRFHKDSACGYENELEPVLIL